METIVLSWGKVCLLESYSEAVDGKPVFRQHGKRPQNFTHHRVANQEDVADLQPMTYLEAPGNGEKFAGASRPQTWAFGIVLNLARNHDKQATSHAGEVGEDEWAQLPCDSDPRRTVAGDPILHRERVGRTHLPDDTRHRLVMQIDAEARYRDIAARPGMPVGRVRSRLSRAGSVLRQAVDA